MRTIGALAPGSTISRGDHTGSCSSKPSWSCCEAFPPTEQAPARGQGVGRQFPDGDLRDRTRTRREGDLRGCRVRLFVRFCRFTGPELADVVQPERVHVAGRGQRESEFVAGGHLRDGRRQRDQPRGGRRRGRAGVLGAAQLPVLVLAEAEELAAGRGDERGAARRRRRRYRRRLRAASPRPAATVSRCRRHGRACRFRSIPTRTAPRSRVPRSCWSRRRPRRSARPDAPGSGISNGGWSAS